MSVKNPVQKGRRNQAKARRLLEDMGYMVETAKFSRWGNTDFFGLWDLIAMDSKDMKLIQVKTNSLPSPAYRESLELFSCPSFISKELWIYYDGKREPRIIKF